MLFEGAGANEVVQTSADPAAETFQALLPIIRSHQTRSVFGERTLVIGVWNDRVIAGFTKKGFYLDPTLVADRAPEAFKTIRWKGSHVDVHSDEVARVAVAASGGDAVFRIAVSGTKQIKFSIALEEAAGVIAALNEAVPERVHVDEVVYVKIADRKKQRERRVARNRRQGRAGIPPFRSAPIGLLLKAIGVALLAGGGAFIYSVFATDLEGSAAVDNLLAGLSLFIIGNLVFRGGRRVGAPSYENCIARDQRPPILFLRSFDSEDVESPVPGSTFSERTMSNLVGKVPYLPWVIDFFISMLRFFYSLQGTFAERIEEQLARLVRRLGPMIAIGEPGERIAAGGAARAYVGDDEWQDFILDAISRAQIVLIQIEATEGTWWEFERCVERVEPQRILIMLTASYGSQSAYEALRVLAANLLPHSLPPYLGNAGFIAFDNEWKPRLLPLIFHPPFLRHVLPSAVNYRKSLKPFLDIKSLTGEGA